MKKVLILIGLGAFLLSSCSDNKQKLEEDAAEIARLTADYQQAATFNDSLMLLMGDIYNGLDSINMQEGLLYNIGNSETSDRRAQVRDNLSAIKARLKANKEMLSQMEAKIKASGNENSVLAKTIAQMKDNLARQDQRIETLESQLSIARDSIVSLNEQVADAQQQIEVETAAKEAAQAAYTEAENEANTVYYAIGTNKELKQNGLLEKKFLGQTKVLRGDFNEAYFTKADKRDLSIIPTGSRKVKIWTNIPESSYEIVENADQTKSIKIVNPKEFWSLSPYLIIQVD